MKRLLTLLIIIIVSGCSNVMDPPKMSKSKIRDRFNECLLEGHIQIILGNSDSAMYYMGMVDAMYEAMHGEKPE